MEARLSSAPWDVAPNANNAALARGAATIGIAAATALTATPHFDLPATLALFIGTGVAVELHPSNPQALS
jgi:hypothetical protein